MPISAELYEYSRDSIGVLCSADDGIKGVYCGVSNGRISALLCSTMLCCAVGTEMGMEDECLLRNDVRVFLSIGREEAVRLVDELRSGEKLTSLRTDFDETVQDDEVVSVLNALQTHPSITAYHLSEDYFGSLYAV